MKYIDADKLIAEIERRKSQTGRRLDNIVPIRRKDTVDEEQLAKIELRDKVDKAYLNGVLITLSDILSFITSLQQEQPNIIEHICLCAGIPAPFMDGNQWSVLKGDNIQVGVVGFGDTKEEALINFIKDIPIQQEQPEVDLEKIIGQTYHDGSVADTSDMDHVDYENIARHFYELGRLNAKNQPSLPPNLDEAAEEYAYRGIPDIMKPTFKPLADEVAKYFKAGAEWMRENLEIEKK